ncbi:MAG: diguanylate cyclase [Magnetococcales bacterium]|nr:diguanylate cyclase [Magnetococcales bacterium]MBF0157289.1 diguanylate cyclase [Magnetococcales bacterium]
MNENKPGYTILIVDDGPENILLLERILSKEYRVISTTHGEEAQFLARKNRPDLIILDVLMPGMDGYQICAHLKSDPETQGIPVIFITAMDQDADEEAGLSLGAVDYLTKPIRSGIARLRIRNQLELKRHRDLLAQLSSQDGLTGIANRRHFDQAIEQEWRRSVRGKNLLSVALIDVDHFKQYNDGYGHQSGDSCLKSLAKAFSKTLDRSTDLVARYGGEEFVCLLADTDLQGALKVGEALRANVESLDIPHDFSPTSPRVTVSIGVATIAPTKTEVPPDSAQLLGIADSCLYKAKQNGRNRVIGKMAQEGAPTRQSPT